jgi:hypothetical protein
MSPSPLTSSPMTRPSFGPSATKINAPERVLLLKRRADTASVPKRNGTFQCAQSTNTSLKTYLLRDNELSVRLFRNPRHRRRCHGLPFRAGRSQSISGPTLQRSVRGLGRLDWVSLYGGARHGDQTRLSVMWRVNGRARTRVVARSERLPRRDASALPEVCELARMPFRGSGCGPRWNTRNPCCGRPPDWVSQREHEAFSCSAVDDLVGEEPRDNDCHTNR